MFVTIIREALVSSRPKDPKEIRHANAFAKNSGKQIPAMIAQLVKSFLVKKQRL